MSLAELTRFLDVIPDAVVVVTREKRVVSANARACEVFQYPPEGLINLSLETLLPDDVRERHNHHVEDYFSSPTMRPMGSGLSLNGRRRDGSLFPVDIMLNRVEMGGMPVAVAIIRDISQQKAREQKLRQESVTDELTTLLNRKQFNLDLSHQLGTLRRTGIGCALVTYDFDHFKSINDNHGHPTGDIVLREASRRILEQLRSGDRAYRVGGEEFALILPGTDLDDAAGIAERVRHTIATEAFYSGDTLIHATVSVGIAQLWPGDDSIGEIIRRADRALYRAKNRGRNQICSETDMDIA
ncbi:PAS domain S-box-containing protein/diguanylate cyclase (GGDEF) domain-containing protein [Marinobacter daqiaonensis]|uniref:diguanylate cyclase n=1 Tax=Marinobacter daqiaonensis TaxID=650891 RepID=A0A1I6JTJ8_9GAMM|nr:sensor domain-containing diguanylate cyclase [Marinobacter daqiaonensis]SFR82241.1 PAS domain S-box-containing protein/diguanylate cyclase (GGDEF) domain-containing protein [Marinobacter daqiaonensis]